MSPLAVEVFSNIPTTTVSSGGTDAPASGTQQTWTVASSTGFPAASSSALPPTQFHIADVALNSEMITVINVSGTTWTVIRGAEGTTPVAHGAGFTIYQVVTAGAYAQLFAVDWLNAVTQFGADSSGTADSTTAVNNALAAAGSAQTVYLPAGTYKLNTSTALSMSIAGVTLAGDGPLATFIEIGGSFAAAEAVSVAAAGCVIRDLGVIGANATLTSNPACNGIELSGFQHCRFENLWFQHVNGWCIESVGGSSTANLDTMISRIVGRNCAAGIHVKGVTGSSFQGEHFLTDIQLQQIGAASGGNANLDGLLIEDCNDVLVQGVNIGTANGTTGSALHIKGTCATVAITNPDVGSTPASGNNAALWIESSSNGSPSGVTINGGSVEGGGAAIQVDAGTDITLNGVRAHQGYTDGLQVNGTTAEVLATGCSLAANNQAGATGYDINAALTGGNFRAVACRTESTVGVSTSGQVTNPVNATTHAYFLSCFFIASNNTPSTVFNGTPQQVVGCVGYNPRGNITAPSVGTSPYTPSTSQQPITIIFTAINGMTQFAIGGTAVPLPAAGVPYYIGVRESVTVTWTTSAPTWQWFGN